MTYQSQKSLVVVIQVSLGVWLLGSATAILAMLGVIPSDTLGLVGIPLVLAQLSLWIGFPLFFHRAYKNLSALGVEGLTYTPGQAVRGFFIPFINLVRPYRTAAELMRASDPDLDRTYATSWMEGRAPRWVLAWFLLFLVATVRVSISPGFDPATPEMQTFMTYLYVVLALKCLALLPAVYLARLLVVSVHERQDLLSSPEPKKDWLHEGIGHVASQGGSAST